MALKIGIMGGTFNPIHNAHLILAETAREQFGLDRILFIPTGTSYLKDTTQILSAEERFKLVQLAIQDNAYFKTSRIEMDRAGNTYTIDTLESLQNMYPGDSFYFIMGADSLEYFPNWYHFEDILKMTTILVAGRGTTEDEKLDELIEEMKTKYLADIRKIICGRMDISSTDIRERIKQGKSIRYLVPDACIDHIQIHKLYTNESAEVAQDDADMKMA